MSPLLKAILQVTFDMLKPIVDDLSYEEAKLQLQDMYDDPEKEDLYEAVLTLMNGYERKKKKLANYEKFSDLRSVRDCYKGLTNETIRADVQANTLPFSVLMSQISGDFNIGSVFRSANGFGAKEMFYYGKKKFDRRSSVGVYHYSKVTYLNTFEKVLDLKKDYTFVALECNDRSVPMKDFVWPSRPLLICGEEQNGVEQQLLEASSHVVHIEMTGSIRSFNVASAASIAMFDYVTKRSK